MDVEKNKIKVIQTTKNSIPDPEYEEFHKPKKTSIKKYVLPEEFCKPSDQAISNDNRYCQYCGNHLSKFAIDCKICKKKCD